MRTVCPNHQSLQGKALFDTPDDFPYSRRDPLACSAAESLYTLYHIIRHIETVIGPGVPIVIGIGKEFPPVIRQTEEQS